MSDTIDTLGALIDGGYRLHVYCQTCPHHDWADLQALAARLGRGHSCMHADLSRRLKCPRCNGRKVEFRLHPPTGPSGSGPLMAPAKTEK